MVSDEEQNNNDENKQNNIEEEQKNIDEIDETLNKDNPYVTIEPETSKILQFIPSKKIIKIPANFKTTSYYHIQFIVKEPNSSAEKMFHVNITSAKLIIKELKKGHRKLNIERSGTGIDTLYKPIPIFDDEE
jgi:hypothetical protein